MLSKIEKLETLHSISFFKTATLFSVFGNMIKHGLSCLMLYIKQERQCFIGISKHQRSYIGISKHQRSYSAVVIFFVLTDELLWSLSSSEVNSSSQLMMILVSGMVTQTWLSALSRFESRNW